LYIVTIAPGMEVEVRSNRRCQLEYIIAVLAASRTLVVRYLVLLKEATMSAITATEARKGLFGLIQQVNDDHTAVEVVSRHGNAVILSKDDYDAMTETAYLLRNPANAERLLAAMERVRRGEFEQHDLLDA
jgi:antitoxin YefM